MESAAKKTYIQPKTMAELMPSLSGILSKDSLKSLTGKKQPRSTMALTRTAEKNLKPLTIAEMRSNILALRPPAPGKFAQPTTSAKKKTWNYSVKLDSKYKSHTANGTSKHSSARKVLNFQPKPKTVQTPKIHGDVKSTVRISGVCNIPVTPMNTEPLQKHKTLANKEKIPNIADVMHKVNPVVSKKQLIAPVPNTPLVNRSWKLGNDTSFLKREKEVQDFEDKDKVLVKGSTQDNNAVVSPSVSTPFKEYQNVQEFFNHSNDTDNCCHDNTIMSFDKISQCKGNSVKTEENVIDSLCGLLNKASVVNSENPNTDDLEYEKHLEDNILMIENVIKMLSHFKEGQLKLLDCVKKKKAKNNVTNENNNILLKAKSVPNFKDDDNLNVTSPISSKSGSVIKSKSPSYKIPRKNSCLRKVILCKSMPNVSERFFTPKKNMDKRAFNMYMEMKEQINFLNTPCVKHNKLEIPDTPTVISHNLQTQLNKIYDDKS